MNRLVEAVDTEDPWVKETFGVSGTGEGIVWYPVGLDDAEGSMPVRRHVTAFPSLMVLTHP